jgi:hypothetical protein
MNKAALFKSCQILLLANIVFWLLAAISFSPLKSAGGSYLLVKILLFLEPCLYLVCLAGIMKGIRLLYLFSLLLTLGNAVLSITDQMGIYDYLSLGLSLMTFLNLVWLKVKTKVY